jgi:hypothetical protein
VAKRDLSQGLRVEHYQIATSVFNHS